MSEIYTIKKYLKNLGGTAETYIGTLKIAYKNKEKAVAKKNELNKKSYSYIYKISALELE